MKICVLGETHLHIHCELSKGVMGRGYIFIQSIVFHLNIALCPGLKVGVLGFIISSNA